MKILFCTDFTEAAQYSFDRAVPFLKENCQVDIISVIESRYLPVGGGHDKQYTEVYRENKIKNLENIRNSLQSKGFKVTDLLYPIGDAADEILEHLRSGDYSLVITGSQAKRLFGKMLGRISRKIAGKSHIPIFIARKNEKNPPNTKQVLFSVDGHENSYNAIKKTAKILDLQDSTIELLYVKQGLENLPIEIISDPKWLEVILEKQQELAEEITTQAEAIIESCGLKVAQKTILEGSAVEKILKHLEYQPKDLIVMGSHGREGISSLLLGSVSRGVLNSAHSPLLIVPTKKTL